MKTKTRKLALTDAIGPTGLMVIKVGTKVLFPQKGVFHEQRFYGLVDMIASLKRRGFSVILVTSGAVACGRIETNQVDNTLDLIARGALAAIGQPVLMQRYREALGERGFRSGQILPSTVDLSSEQAREHLRSQIQYLLGMGAVPTLNGNDPTSPVEFCNDSLAAHVVELTGAQLLVIYTDVDGVYSRPPGEPGAQLITEVLPHVQLDLEQEQPGASETAVRNGMGTGGIRSKVRAGRRAQRRGSYAVVTRGSQAVFEQILKGDPIPCTWFLCAPPLDNDN